MPAVVVTLKFAPPEAESDSDRLSVPSPFVITEAVTGVPVNPLIALASSESVSTDGEIVTDPTAVSPTLTVTVWPWVRSSSAGIPVALRTPLVLTVSGSTPAETRPPVI